jgi:hypothetical protein
MIDTVYKIVAFAITLGVLVVFHELGHYVVARLAGVSAAVLRRLRPPAVVAPLRPRSHGIRRCRRSRWAAT